MTSTRPGAAAGVIPPPPFEPGQGRPFTTRSPWNTPIVADPVLDRRSRAIARYLGGGRPHTAVANLYEFGIPVFDADAGDPHHRVRCTKPWGTCPVSRRPLPIPRDARPSQGSDAAMIVVDWSRHEAYEFWQARRDRAGWVASWGEVIDLDSDGTGRGATGAGVPTLAGVVRTYEIERGRIDHALVFSTDNACRTVHRHPASKTDGTSDRSDCIPEGARVQLDPSIDVDLIPGLTFAERAVARALQVYGAYCRDSGGARLAFIFQDPAGGPDPYPQAGLVYDYDHMPHIPWSKLRVLRRWDGR